MAKLQIKDGNGDSQELYVHSGSDGLVPYHAVSGSVTAAMQSSDLSSITGSMLAVSGAIGLFNSQLYSALTGGPVSMSVDIVAGDVNTITGSMDKVTAEVAKLTALSSSNGLKIYGNLSASLDNGASSGDPLYVSLVNTGSLTASVAISNSSLTVTASATSPVYVTGSVASAVTFPAVLTVTSSVGNPVYVSQSSTVPVTGTVRVDNFPTTYTVTSSAALPVFVSASNSLPVSGTVNVGNTITANTARAASSAVTSAAFGIPPSTANLSANGRLSVIFSNQTNAAVLIALTASAAGPTNFSYYLMPYETYESAPVNAGLPHYFNYSGSATTGYWALTTTI